MTQRIPTDSLELRQRRGTLTEAESDLLSLRSAVRRWMKADDEACGGEVGSGWKLVDLDEARADLRAEMAGIDDSEGDKPCS